MKRKITLTARQKEWFTRLLLMLVFVGLPTLLNAQGTANTAYAGEDADAAKIRIRLVNLFTIILTSIAIGIVLIKPGWHFVIYALHNGEERGQEAMNKLKAGLTTVAIGCGGALSVGLIGNLIAKALVV